MLCIRVCTEQPLWRTTGTMFAARDNPTSRSHEPACVRAVLIFFVQFFFPYFFVDFLKLGPTSSKVKSYSSTYFLILICQIFI